MENEPKWQIKIIQSNSKSINRWRKMSITVTRKNAEQPRGTNPKGMHNSQATNMTALLESQSSIFDNVDKFQSFSKPPRDSFPTNFGVSGLQTQQPQQKRLKTFKDILENIDEQEKEAAKQKLKESATDDSQSDATSVSNKRLSRLKKYRQYCFKNDYLSPLQATQELDQAKSADAKHVKAPLRARLPAEPQQNDGVLSRQETLKEPKEAVSPDLPKIVETPELVEEGKKAVDTITQTGTKKEPLNIVLHDSKEDLGNDYKEQQSIQAVPKIYPKTPEGINKLVMPDRLDKDYIQANAGPNVVQAYSIEPDDKAQTTSLQGNQFVVMETHRVPVIVDQRVPPLTDRMNTNMKVADSTQQSLVNASSFHQQDDEDEEDEKPNCYLLLPWDDIKLVVQSINDDNEQMKIYFGCKALKNILLVSNPEVTHVLLRKFSKRILKRMVVVLSYEHLPEAMGEALHVVVLLTNLMDYDITSEMVQCGLVYQLNKFIDLKFIQMRSNKICAELALQIVANITQINNLSIAQLQMVFVPELTDDSQEHETTPNLSFLDRMVQLAKKTETTCMDVSQIQNSQTNKIPIVLDNNHILTNVHTQPTPNAHQNPHSNTINRMDMNARQSQGSKSPLILLHNSHSEGRPRNPLTPSQLSNYTQQVGPSQMADLRIQTGYIARQLLCRLHLLGDEDLLKAATLCAELVINAQVSAEAPKYEEILGKNLITWESAVHGLRMVCGQYETVCEALNGNGRVFDFAAGLLTILTTCMESGEHLGLLMDTLVVVGDLTASVGFAESAIFERGDGFETVKKLLQSNALVTVEIPRLSPISEQIPEETSFQQKEEQKERDALSGKGPLSKSSKSQNEQRRDDTDLTALKFKEMIAWTITNAVADDPDCQDLLLKDHLDLLMDLMKLVQLKNTKINAEICFLLENVLEIPSIESYLFAEVESKERPPTSQGDKTERLQPNIKESAHSDASISRGGLTFKADKCDGQSMMAVDRTGNISRAISELMQQESPLFAKVLWTLQEILSERDVYNSDEDDQVDFFALKNVNKLLRLDKAKVIEHITGGQCDLSEEGMPLLVTCIYEMQHHWSRRVYRKAFMIAQKYFTPRDLKMTDIFTDLCQEELTVPEESHCTAKQHEYVRLAKSKPKGSVESEEHTSDEEARDRAATFMMSVGQKRAYEAQKKMEREYNAKFKITFVEVVRSHEVSVAPNMQVIDMTLQSLEKPKGPIMAMTFEELDDPGINQRTIPGTQLTYEKLIVARKAREKELQRLKEEQACLEFGDDDSQREHSNTSLGEKRTRSDMRKNSQHPSDHGDSKLSVKPSQLSMKGKRTSRHQGTDDKSKSKSAKSKKSSVPKRKGSEDGKSSKKSGSADRSSIARSAQRSASRKVKKSQN